MKFIFSVSLFLLSFVVHADARRDNRIYRAGTVTRTVSIDQLGDLVSIRSAPPHRQLNPENKTFTFEGIAIQKLLGLSKKDQNKTIYFIATDNYVSAIPASVLLKSNAILALKQDGKPIEERLGGLQVIFPTEGPDAVEERYAKKAAFWCWYVRSIVIGDLVSLKIGKAPLKVPAKLAEQFTFDPPSVFQFEKRSCPKTVRIPLNKLTRSDSLVLRILSGESKNVETERYDLILSDRLKPLPVHCGGPFLLAERSRVATSTTPILARNLETGVIEIEAKK